MKMDFKTYLEKLETLDKLESRVRALDDEFREYKAGFIRLLERFREIYDMELVESGSYPTF